TKNRTSPLSVSYALHWHSSSTCAAYWSSLMSSPWCGTSSSIAMLMLPKQQRLIWPAISWIGIVGCLALFVLLPRWAIIAGIGALAGPTLVRLFALRHYRPG